MALLTKPLNTFERVFETSDNAPEGTFQATIIDIKDQFGVERKKFQSEEMETTDVTTFLFGFRDNENRPYKIASKTMKISGSEKSTLIPFLKSILGKAPAYGWDYCELKGRKCLLTVEHVARQDGSTYPAIAALSPIPVGMNTLKPAEETIPTVPVEESTLPF
jgi:hypothetical protein